MLTALRRRLAGWLLAPDERPVPSGLLFDWQRGAPGPAPCAEVPLPPALAAGLRGDDPELAGLRRRYAAFDPRVTSPALWVPGTVSDAELTRFRGETAYVWQRRGAPRSINAYALAAYYCLALGRAPRWAERLGRLDEDGLFGALVYEIAGRRVSRDLLDSIAELDGIDRRLGIGAGGVQRVLDIGAGYGRLAHRAVCAFPEIEHFLCTDAVPESSFLCRRYLAARGIEDRAEAVALDRIDARLAEVAVDLAVNIHSFSECRPQAIDWWLALLARHRVRWLMVAPNAMDHGGARLLTNAGVDFAPLIARHGYRLRWRAPKFVDSLVQRYGLSPTMYHFFELG